MKPAFAAYLGVCYACSLWPAYVHATSDSRINNLREETVSLFYHGYRNYMEHAFPDDELRPLTCGPLTRDRHNPHHIELNDVLGNYSLTLIDSLSTLAILSSSDLQQVGEHPLWDFQDGIRLLVDQYGDGSDGERGAGKRANGFDLDSKVQVFETTIRGVGGLLSAHLFAIGELPIRGYHPLESDAGILWPNGFIYDGQLLRLAKDLADRLLPAFESPTGIPYPRVNLRYGIPFYPNSPWNIAQSLLDFTTDDCNTETCANDPSGIKEITETCSAGAGSLVLEFSTLSRLLDDYRYETVAKRAFDSIWQRRSQIDLIGAGVDAESGNWVSPLTGIGAGVDSFFEYALKSYVLLSHLPSSKSISYVDGELLEPDSSQYFLDVWKTAHRAIKRHVLRQDTSQHGHYIQVDMNTGAHRYLWFDSLSAFYPGLLTLAGEIDEAEAAHLLFTALWTRYSALPERFSITSSSIENGIGWWGGRPEFIESAWYLFHATEDPWYLHVGEMALKDMQRRCRTTCGWAGLQDVRTGQQSDRLESFFLGETAKYLFLLFDPSHPLNKLDAPFVFTTEGHPLIIPRPKPGQARQDTGANSTQHLVNTNTESDLDVCQVPNHLFALFGASAVAVRNDVFHASHLVKLHSFLAEKIDMAAVKNDTTTLPTIRLREEFPSGYFPWTLPSNLIPANGTCKALQVVHVELTFPHISESDGEILANSIIRIPQGFLLRSISNVRLSLVKEKQNTYSEEVVIEENVLRAQAISGISLGRDETVFIQRGAIFQLNEQDPYFTRKCNSQAAELLIGTNTTKPAALGEPLPERGSLPKMKSRNKTLQALAQAIRSFHALLPLLSRPSISTPLSYPTSSTLPEAISGTSLEPLQQHTLQVALPTGPGAYFDNSLDLNSNFHLIPSSGSVYLATHNLCNDYLPADVPQQYRVVVVRRGGCSFSTKLAHIPHLAQNQHVLRLLIVVSFPETDSQFGATQKDSSNGNTDNGFGGEHTQPYLDKTQTDSAGSPSTQPVSLVLAYGGQDTWDLLQAAESVTLLRKFWFESQGTVISNIIVV